MQQSDNDGRGLGKWHEANVMEYNAAIQQSQELKAMRWKK